MKTLRNSYCGIFEKNPQVHIFSDFPPLLPRGREKGENIKDFEDIDTAMKTADDLIEQSASEYGFAKERLETMAPSIRWDGCTFL